MKILIFNTLYQPNQLGGAEKSVQLLAEGLLMQGQEPIIVCTSDKDCIDYINGIKVFYVKTTNLYWSYNAKEERKYKKPLWHLLDSYNPFNKKIEKILDKEKPNVVHTNNLAGFSVSVWSLAKRKNIKIVHTLRDYYLLCPKSTMFKENKNCELSCSSCKFYSIPKKKISEYVDEVVGISQFIRNKHIEAGYFKNAKKSVVFNSIKVMDCFNKEKTNFIRFGFVGSLSESKGIKFLLDNFKKLNLNNVILNIYGKGSTKVYENSLKENYSNDKIFFKGFQKVEEIYQNIDILIVPSLWNEPFGRIVPEANSYGIPVFVTNKGGLPELVENGKNGYIFNPDIPNDFENKIELILEMYKKNNFEFDLSAFSYDDIINKYLEVYSK